LFLGLRSDQPSGVTTRPPLTDRVELLHRAQDDSRTVINRPQVPTIYPPLAQLWFGAVAAVTPWPLGTLGLQNASALLASVVAGAAAAVKLTPLVVLPAFMPLRRNGVRHSWQASVAAIGTLVASYAPHVLIVGGLVLGHLP